MAVGALFAGAVLVVARPAGAQNLVTNPNFDTGVAPWFIDGWSDTALLWGASGYTPASGSGVIFAAATQEASVRLQQIVTITEPGTRYRFSAAVSRQTIRG